MLPKPEASGDFLKADNLRPLLNKAGFAVAKVADSPRMGKYGVDVPVTIGKDSFVLTLSEKNRDYALVAKTFGLDPDEWTGRKLKVGLREYVDKKTDEEREAVTIVGAE